MGGGRGMWALFPGFVPAREEMQAMNVEFDDNIINRASQSHHTCDMCPPT